MEKTFFRKTKRFSLESFCTVYREGQTWLKDYGADCFFTLSHNLLAVSPFSSSSTSCGALVAFERCVRFFFFEEKNDEISLKYLPARGGIVCKTPCVNTHAYDFLIARYCFIPEPQHDPSSCCCGAPATAELLGRETHMRHRFWVIVAKYLH